MKFSRYLTLVVYCFWVSIALAQTNKDDNSIHSIQFESGYKQVMLLEMYSSQGCSSCPPAEKWLNKFTEADNVWRDFIPVVYHVDYWDYLGWKDPYSSQQFSARQGTLKQQGLVRSIYTPGFTINGREWRGWFSGKSLPNLTLDAGNLKVNLAGQKLKASYSNFKPNHRLNVAILGFDLTTQVTAGENRSRVLNQEFVVLDYQQMFASDKQWSAPINLAEFRDNKLGLAVWVTQGASLKPIQATGGKLPVELLVAQPSKPNHTLQSGYSSPRFIF